MISRIDFRLGLPFSFSLSFALAREVEEPVEELDVPEWVRRCPDCGSHNIEILHGEVLDENTGGIILRCPECSWGFTGEISYTDMQSIEEFLEEQGFEDDVSRFKSWLDEANPSDFVGK